MDKEKKQFNIAFSVGETSGDLNASCLILELKKRFDFIKFYGIGGKKMKDAGVDILFDTSGFGTIGVVQALKLLPGCIYFYNKFKNKLLKDKPDLLVCVDFGFFNTRIAQVAHKANIPVIYYFPPASWKRDLKHADALVAAKCKVITIFPWSEKVLQNFGLEAKYVGHPLIDIAKPTLSKEDFYLENNLSQEDNLLGFLLGSRKFEIDMHIKDYANTIKALYIKNPNYKFLVASTQTHHNYIVKRLKRFLTDEYKNVRVICQETYNIMAYSNFLFCCSGTATLEAAIIGTPMAIIYKGTKLMQMEYEFRKKTTPTLIGMPNIIKDHPIIIELIGKFVTPVNMISAYEYSMEYNNCIKEKLKEVKDILGEPNVISRIADTFAEMANLN